MSWRWGRIIVEAAREPLRDAVLFPGGAHAWDWRQSGTDHRVGVQLGAVVELIERGARTVVLSTGVLGALHVPEETVDFLKREGVIVHVERTPAAVKRYNALSATDAVGALIHSTC